MNEKNLLKQAVVLLLIALMIVSSGVVGANTSTNNKKIIQKEASGTIAPLSAPIVWDNVMGVYGSRGGIIVATVRTEGTAFPADDFQLATETQVTSIAWQGGYFVCQLAQGQIDYHWNWRILFWNDIGNGSWPGTEIYNQTIPDAQIWREHWYNYTRPSDGYTYWVANYSCELPVPIIFNANTKYWITLQTIQTPNANPQGCWSRHNDTVGGIKLHEAMFKAPNYWTYPNWVTIYTVLVNSGDPDPHPHDLNFQLFGEEVADTTPPETHCSFNGTLEGDHYISDVIVTITATDDISGVNYTKYNLDSGGWTTYTVPFTVTDDGLHVLQCYSVDKAGNEEVHHYCNFTIQHPAPPITITIKGGFGVSATIKNTGTANLTNISWSITLDGKLVFVGKSKTGTIAALAPGDSQVVKDLLVIGFGKTGIAVEAAGVEESATGTVILFLVIGVK
jgi:hypothetical protein